jgi:hypothetical protein
MKTLNYRYVGLGAYAVLLLLYFLGIRFDLAILNYIGALVLLTSLWYFTYFVFTIATKNHWLQFVKYIVGTLIGLLALGSILLMLFIAFGIYSLATDWHGKDLSNEEIRRIQMNNFVDVVVYRTDGGATTDFGANIMKEIDLGIGLKISNSIDGIYHARDIEVERVDDHSIRIKHIDFTGGYGPDYYREGGTLKDGDILEI